MSAARECTVALIGCGRVGRAFLELVVARRAVVEARTGVQLRVTAIADSSTLLVNEPGFTDAHLRYVVAAKAAGTPLLGADPAAAAVDTTGAPPGPLPGELGALGGRGVAWSVIEPGAAASFLAAHPSRVPDVVVDLTDESSAEALVALRDAGSALALGNKRPLIQDMAVWHALTGPHAGGPPTRWEATVASSLPVVGVVRSLADAGDPPLLMVGALSGTLGVILAHMAGGGTANDGLQAALRAGLAEPDPRRDLAGIDTAAKALILARTAGWDAELEDVDREPLMGVDWTAVPVGNVEGELGRQSAGLAATLADGRDLRYLASVSDGGIRVGVSDSPTELAHLSPANSGVLVQTRGFGAFPLLLSGRGGGSGAAAEAVLGDVVDIARDYRS